MTDTAALWESCDRITSSTRSRIERATTDLDYDIEIVQSELRVCRLLDKRAGHTQPTIQPQSPPRHTTPGVRMTDDEPSITVHKISVTQQVSSELLFPSIWQDYFAREMNRALGYETDTRTPEEREQERAAASVAAERARAEIRARHINLAAHTDGLRRAVLVMHGPEFYGEFDRYPHCAGCEAQGCESEQPAFPCQTYELARDHG